jgi:hypothetical protein
MNKIEILTIFAAIFELAGIYLLGKKYRLGFISNMIGSVFWITYTVITGNAIGLIMICGVAFILNTKGFWYWDKKDKEESIKNKLNKYIP